MKPKKKVNPHMLQKTADKLARKNRPTWVGYYSRITPTKSEKQNRINKKHRKISED